MFRNGEIKSIKKEGLILLDANSLLNIYRFSKENREKYFEILEKVKDRLYLSNQSGKEFYENRLTIIYNRANFKAALTEELVGKIELIKESVHKNNFTSSNKTQGTKESCNLIKHEESLKNDIINILEYAETNIKNKINSFENDITYEFINRKDPILDKIINLFEGKVSDELKKEELDELYKEGKERYSKQIPPGYKDLEKKEPRCYGDLIIWKDIIKIAKKNDKDILFVSDDRKEDWCEKFKNYDLGPRKELIEEFFLKTNGKKFHSIKTSEFIDYISELHNVNNIEELKYEALNFIIHPSKIHPSKIQTTIRFNTKKDIKTGD